MAATASGQLAWLLAALTSLSSCDASKNSDEGTISPTYKHVVLISLDTTRADAIGSYGGKASSTPRIDQLATSGIRFADATSAAPSTLNSHTSIMTGLYARRHGVARNGFVVNEDNITLAEVLRDGGFHTAGFIGSFALDSMFGFDQGFDHWDQDFTVEFRPGTADQNQRPADVVTSAVLDYVENFDGSERLFLFAHYFDVHSPYSPPEPFATKFAKGPKRADFARINQQIALHQQELTGKTREVYKRGLSRALARDAHGRSLPGDESIAALYAGELAFLDTQIGRLLDGLEAKNILQDSIVILVGDHGETFWEHGDFWAHGSWVYQTNVHVPFLMRFSDGRGQGRVILQPVSSTDIFPTLLDLLGIALPAPVAGVSLVGVIDGRQLPQRSIFSEATQPVNALEEQTAWANQLKTKAVRRGKWKYIVAPYLRYQELYDLEQDPAERNNLIGSGSREVAVALVELRGALAAWRNTEEPLPSKFNPKQMNEVLKRLKQLGYVGGVDASDSH